MEPKPGRDIRAPNKVLRDPSEPSWLRLNADWLVLSLALAAFLVAALITLTIR